MRRDEQVRKRRKNSEQRSVDSGLDAAELWGSSSGTGGERALRSPPLDADERSGDAAVFVSVVPAETWQRPSPAA